MLWRGRRQSGNIEDQRGRPGGLGGFPRIGMPRGGPFGGGIGPRSRFGGGVGLIVIVVLILLFGGDLLNAPNQSAIEDRTVAGSSAAGGGASDELRDFIAVVLADTEDVWNAQFSQLGGDYAEPKLVLFSGGAGSACGFAQPATGPFYCPGDRKIYIDLGFYRELRDRFKAPGDFAQAYVLAHEVGHHVQNLMGVMDDVAKARNGTSREEQNALSVRVELQADCYAGLWANHAQRTKQILEPGDIDEALGAASAVGDDRIQKQTQGYVVPDAFTHGTAEQRTRWFRRGFESGSLNACDTFEAAQL
jgi:hypothetical protein